MGEMVKLTDIQAKAIRDAKHVTVNGRTTQNCASVKGSNYRTYNRLFELGLIAGSHENAALTELGVNAWASLNSDATSRKVLTGDPTHKVYVVKAAETETPAAEAPAVAPVAETPTPQRYMVQPMGHGFAVMDSENGRAVTPEMGSRFAANDAAERYNQVPVAEVPAEPVKVPNGTDLARAFAAVAADWPEGTRVAGKDTADQDRTGTVYRGDDGIVTVTGHANYGRTYVGVIWDDNPELRHRIPRNRPFTDTLTRI